MWWRLRFQTMLLVPSWELEVAMSLRWGLLSYVKGSLYGPLSYFHLGLCWDPSSFPLSFCMLIHAGKFWGFFEYFLLSYILKRCWIVLHGCWLFFYDLSICLPRMKLWIPIREVLLKLLVWWTVREKWNIPCNAIKTLNWRSGFVQGPACLCGPISLQL